MRREVSALVLLGLLAGFTVLAGCDAKEAKSVASSTPAQSESTLAPNAATPQTPLTPAAPVTQASWTPDALEELLAPIALYPDQLLGQILAASINAQEVLDAGNWLLQNQQLTGDALDEAATKAGFGPPMRALLPFPTVIDMMCQQIDWTRQLGGAFTSDQKAVLDAVQRLRLQAHNVGSLKSTPQQKVEQHTEGDKVIVEVKPADPKVVYVPQYDSQAVYAPPPPAPATTTTSTESTVSTGAAVAGGLLAFGVGVVLGKALDHDDDYYYPHWNTGVVVVGPRPFYPPAYVYHPAYGPAFRPAYRYAPPAGYRHAYNNVNVNVNRNVVVNNNDYFNRFTNNQNVRAGSSSSWKGRTTYAAAGGPNNVNRRVETQARIENPVRRETAAVNRQLPQGAPARVDRGYGRTEAVHTPREPASARPMNATRQTELPPRQDADVQRHRDADVQRRVDAAGAAEARPEPAHIARADNGSFDRAASARGRASVGGRELRHR